MERDPKQTQDSIQSNSESNQNQNQRRSARVRAAAKSNELAAHSSSAQDTETAPGPSTQRFIQPEPFSSRTATRRTNRSLGGAVTSAGIVINEPPKDVKGKKRALPEPDSDEDSNSNELPPPPPPKKARSYANVAAASSSSTSYSLRPRKSAPNLKQTSSSKVVMPPKAARSPGKRKAAAIKALATSSSMPTDDVEMRDVDPGSAIEYDSDQGTDEDEVMGDSSAVPPPVPEEAVASTSDAPIADSSAVDPPPPPPLVDEPSPPAGGDAAAGGLFGSDFQSIGSYMLNLSSRLKTILENIKAKADPTTRLISLQELSELLSISTEDTLSGYFQIDAFVRELVRIMGGTGNTEDEDGNDGDDNEESNDNEEQDEDAALAAALAMSTGGPMPGQDSLEAQVLACRCLANLMEALPGCAHTVVYHGAVPVLCSKLVEIHYIDLAEQSLSTLEKISEEYPSAIVREGGLSALLNYLDFFSTNVQRTALRAASNCCRNASTDNFQQIKDVFPTIRKVLCYSDQRLVEFACLCVIRVIESFYRSSPELLDSILDAETVKAINVLLLPAGGSPLVSPNTYTSFLKMLAAAAKASPQTTLSLLDADIVSTIYQILTGVLPPAHDDGAEQGKAPGGQGLGGGLADMAVMQNLAHRPKDQVEEALSLVSELMPPLPKDGVFDHRAYTEKALAKAIKAKGKADRAAARAAHSSSTALAPTVVPVPAPTTPTPVVEDTSNSSQVASSSNLNPNADDSAAENLNQLPGPSVTEPAVISDAAQQEKEKEKQKLANRIEVLRQKPELVRRFARSIVPVLVDVYAATVALQVRSRTLSGILKAVSWMEPDELNIVLKNVPMASFIGSILSSNDNPALIIGALQLVELLLMKLPQLYKSSLRREGVLHEIEIKAGQDLTTKVKTAPEPVIIVPEPMPIPVPLPVEEVVPSPVETTVVDPPPPSDETGAQTEPVIIPPPGDAIMDPPPLPSSALLAAMMPPPVKRSSSSSIDPQDAIIIRCRTIRFKYLQSSSHSSADDPLESMQALGRRLAFAQASEAELRKAMSELAALFAGGGKWQSVSSFELTKSGLVDDLLEFATVEGRKVPLITRQKILLETFTSRSGSGPDNHSSQSAFAMLVKRLQECLTRLETFEVITVSQGEDLRRGSASMLARQLRLRLVAAEGTTVPRNCTNITVSIHAIATFQALHDYLRPRIAGVGPGSSRLNGVLAAFAAAAGIPSGSLSRRGMPSALSQALDAAASMPPPASAPSSSAAEPDIVPKMEETAPPAPAIRKPRRSLRLRKEAPPPTDGSPEAESSTAAAGPSENAGPGVPQPSTLNSSMIPDDYMDDMDQEDDFLGDDFEADVYDDTPSVNQERTVSLAVAEDGQKVEAQTPDGTRVATPNPAAAFSSAAPPEPKGSYASALKSKPTDWHLQFSMDENNLPLDMTVYGAVHQHILRSDDSAALLNNLWNGVYTIKFQKVPGPAPLDDVPSTERAPSPMTTSVPEDTAHAKILRLLRVLHQLNAKGSERLVFDKVVHTLPDSAFINNKLTAKLTRQLEEPMIVASSCLPDWALDLPQHYPFLFPFSTRFSFLQSTSFGYARLILKWQSQQTRSSDSNPRRDEAFGYLGRLQRQKVRISRKLLLESAIKVLELYGSGSSVLEVEYFDEVGTGLGPTLEFYSLVSKEFARKNLKMWHDADPSSSSHYVSHPTGLYPAPLSRREIASASTGAGKKRTDIFRVLGQFAAKALLDSRIIDIAINKIFFKFILGEEVPLTMGSLKVVDPQLSQSLSKLQPFIDAKRAIDANSKMTAATKKTALAALTIDGIKLDDLTLDFTLPGYDIELRDGGKDISVDASNVEDYIKEVLEALVGRGVQLQAQAFKEGFSKVFPVTDLQSFTSDELAMMFGNADEDWSSETLAETMKADHGFNIDSRAMRDLISIMSEYDATERRAYLQFITGSPRLPVGGFRTLSPPLTVVRKPHEPPLRSDDYLPSVMTCVNYLKLPEYSTKEVMKHKLGIAMREGVGSFHLS